MKLFRNRFVIGGLCVLAAAVLAFFVLPRLNEAKEATVMVVRAVRDIDAGDEIAEKDLELIEVGAYNLPKGIFNEKQPVIGNYAKVPMLTGDFIMDTKLSSVRFSTLMEKAVNEKKHLLTITLSNTAAGVGGHLQAGDIVAVRYFVPETKETETVYDEELETDVVIETVIPACIVDDPLLSRITLYAVENASAETITTDDSEGAQALDRAIPKTATLIVTEEQMQAILLAEYTSKIHLVFVSRGDS